jgi:hypothetical protein
VRTKPGAPDVAAEKSSPFTPQRILIVLLILLLPVGVGLLAWNLHQSSKFDEVREMGNDLFANRDNLTQEERREKFDALRNAREELTPEQRKEEERLRFRDAEERVKPYFELQSDDERKVYLDKAIDEEEQRMERIRERWGGGAPPWMAFGGQGAQGIPGGQGAPGGQGNPGGQGVSGRQGNQGNPNPGQPPAGANQGGNNPGGQGNPNWGGQGGFRNMTTEQREVRRKEMLDHSTAEGRAQMAAFRRDMDTRRTQRGLGPAWGGFGGR